MHYLGIDWGEKRIGLAYADALGVPVPLPAATATRFSERMDHLQTIISERKINCLVVGYPFNMDGSVGFKAREVDTFIEALEKRFQLPVVRADERLTSHLVESENRNKKKRFDRRSGEVDSLAAVVILRDYINEHELMQTDYDDDDLA
jgi:putative Holliday junction resolvase